jgi:hypothetical protein
MQWTQIDHAKMEPLKDPRFDGTETPSSDPRPTVDEDWLALSDHGSS